MNILRRQMLNVAIGLGTCTGMMPMTCQAAADERNMDCSKDILLAYFPEVLVNETLKNFNVPQDQWEMIDKELAVKDKEIMKLVESKANKITPNPLKDPQQRQAAVKLFRDTLFESFSSVMKKHGVTDDAQIHKMLDDIQQQKAKRFAQCMEAHKHTHTHPSPDANSKPADLDSDEG